jgi:dihydroxyacetone kinase-like predicted kinase
MAVVAIEAFNALGETPAVCAAMEEAAGRVASGAVAVATRAISLNGVRVAYGEYVALADGRLCAAGKSATEVVPDLLRALAVETRERVTLYYGAAVTLAVAKTVAAHIDALYPYLDVELVYGGQSHYRYIIGVA